jgi:3-deoxy-D-manno-octulosonic-acid transferase
LSAYFSKIIYIKIALAKAIVFLENSHYIFFTLVNARLSIHSFHKFLEWNTASLIHIELRYHFINRLFYWIKTILRQQYF